MQILGLGHSSWLLEMSRDDASAEGPLRILGDPWLSDWLIGDLLGRFPRLRFEPRDLGPLDGIWLSHSHTDHLDPESLVRLYAELDPRPPLLLPESLRFLEPIFREHLPAAELVFLSHEKEVEFRGLRLMAFFNPETCPTNEDDVMVLVVRSLREVLLVESDALLPFYDPETRASLAELLGNEEIDTACFLTIKNEGDGTMAMLDSRDAADRQARLSRCLESLYEELWTSFGEVGDPEEDLWRVPRLIRLIGGQGMCYPQELGTEWNRILFPIRLADRVRMEREVSEQCGLELRIEELVPGSWHRLAAGSLVERQVSREVELLDAESDRDFRPDLDLFEDFPSAPLVDEARPREAQETMIDSLLGDRFLPWLIGRRAPPIEHLLAASGGEYRIRIRYGTTANSTDIDHVLRFATLAAHGGFVAEAALGDSPDEWYWANDLDDFLAGRADEFSTFNRHPLAGREQRLWCCLGLPFLNNDIIARKIDLHFRRARAGESNRDWALPFWSRPTDERA